MLHIHRVNQTMGSFPTKLAAVQVYTCTYQCAYGYTHTCTQYTNVHTYNFSNLCFKLVSRIRLQCMILYNHYVFQLKHYP